MMNSNVQTTLLALALMSTAPACDSAGGQCTLIGCGVDGLTVSLTGC